MSLQFTRLALDDLRSILVYIAKERPQTARQVVQRLRAKCELIATHPEIGQVRPELAPDMRSFSVERWVIYYKIQDNSVIIRRVLDGARDLREFNG